MYVLVFKYKMFGNGWHCVQWWMRFFTETSSNFNYTLMTTQKTLKYTHFQFYYNNMWRRCQSPLLDFPTVDIESMWRNMKTKLPQIWNSRPEFAQNVKNNHQADEHQTRCKNSGRATVDKKVEVNECQGNVIWQCLHLKSWCFIGVKAQYSIWTLLSCSRRVLSFTSFLLRHILTVNDVTTATWNGKLTIVFMMSKDLSYY